MGESQTSTPVMTEKIPVIVEKKSQHLIVVSLVGYEEKLLNTDFSGSVN